MIKLPDLDNQKYADILEAAKRRIPIIFPEWTDLNEHDPGITIIEVFAWLKEMQQYYMNRISDRSRENMLRLLGIEIRPAAPAEATVIFPKEAPERLWRGVSVFADDRTEFVSTEEYKAAPFKLGRMFSENTAALTDTTDLAYDGEVSFYPFGARLGRGDRSFYIEISEISGESFFDGAELMFDVSDRLPVRRNAPDPTVPPPRGIVWEYSTEKGFLPCEVLLDSTYALSFGGSVILKTGPSIAPYGIGRLPKSIWIRGRMIACGCEDMPLLRRIYCGGLRLTQKTRLAASEDAVLTEGNLVEIGDMLAADGLCFAFVRDRYGWIFDENASVVSGGEDCPPKIRVSADGASGVRVVCCEKSFCGSRVFFSSNGLPSQQFEFDTDGEVLCGELRIMVKDRESDPFPRWNEYRYIESLSLAGAYDRCFTYDAKRRSLIFGNNEHGEAPPPGDENIMVISCSVTKGEKGNITAGNLKELIFFGKAYPLDGTDSTGGRDRESLTHALGRLKERIGERERAVTADDYRALALHTPGLRIADAAAIPFFDPELSETSEDKAPNTIAVAVLPYSAERLPMPDERFLAAVRAHLEKYRMLNVKISVTAPVYIRVDIDAEVICTAREVGRACDRVKSEILRMFSVYGADGRTRFGNPVTETDIRARICAVEEILSVTRLRIRTDDSRYGSDRYGRVSVPPNAVTYCGSVEIRADYNTGSEANGGQQTLYNA